MYTVRGRDHEVSYNFKVSDRPEDPKNCTIVSHRGQTMFVDNIKEYARFMWSENTTVDWSYVSIVNGEAQEVKLEEGGL